MEDIIEIELPELSLDDMVAHECYFCDGVMMPCYVSGVYTYKDQKYRVSGMRVWKCFKCNMEAFTGKEVDRVTHSIYEYAMYEKARELNAD